MLPYDQEKRLHRLIDKDEAGVLTAAERAVMTRLMDEWEDNERATWAQSQLAALLPDETENPFPRSDAAMGL